MQHLPFGQMSEQNLTDKAKRVYDKFKAAERLPQRIRVSLWGDTPLVSPRAAKLLSDPETSEVLMRAIRAPRTPRA